MKLLLSSLLLSSLCNLSSWSVASDTLVVTQTADLSVMEGETVNISCCFRAKFDRMTVKWLKNQTDVKSELFNSNNSQIETSGCSNLTLTNIRTEDSGRYICKVSMDIPYYIDKNGNGTKITVSHKKNRTQDETEASDLDPSPTSSPPALPVIISLAIVAPLLLVALICFCTLQRRQARAARVIYEVPHIDSDVAEMDKHSTSSSRGSSQWCQVPVYESFDYFERVQTKESG